MKPKRAAFPASHFPFRRAGKFFCQFVAYPGTGDVQGQSALMFAGAGRRDGDIFLRMIQQRFLFFIQLLLAGIGTVSGYAVKLDMIPAGLGKKQGRPVRRFLSHEFFRIAFGGAKREESLRQIFWNVSGGKTMVFVDQTHIGIHKKPPVSQDF